MSADDYMVGGDHYKRLEIEPWAAMEAWSTVHEFLGFLKNSAIGYLARANLKGDLEDIQKAKHCLEKYIETAIEASKQEELPQPVKTIEGCYQEAYRRLWEKQPTYFRK